MEVVLQLLRVYNSIGKVLTICYFSKNERYVHIAYIYYSGANIIKIIEIKSFQIILFQIN